MSDAIALIQRYYDAFNRGDWAAMLDCLTDDVAHDLNQGGREHGREAFRAFLTAVIKDRDTMVLGSTGGPSVPSARSRAAQNKLHQRIRELIARGREDGTVKRAIDVGDIAWLGATLARPGRPGNAWEKVAGRLLDTYIAGLGVE